MKPRRKKQSPPSIVAKRGKRRQTSVSTIMSWATPDGRFAVERSKFIWADMASVVRVVDLANKKILSTHRRKPAAVRALQQHLRSITT